MKVSFNSVNRFALYYGLMKMQLLSAFSTCLTGFINLLCICNAAIYLLNVNDYTQLRVLIIGLQVGILVLTVKSRKGFKDSLLEFFHACVYKNYYSLIIKDIRQIPIAYIKECNTYCLLSESQQYFLVYLLSDELYICSVFSLQGDTYQFDMDINLLEKYVPHELYNGTIRASLVEKKANNGNATHPLATEPYEHFVNTVIRTRAIDCILEDLS